jgi:hypothetical protein
VFSQSARAAVSGDRRDQGGKDRWDGELGGFVHKSPSNSHEEDLFGIALLLSDRQGGQVGRVGSFLGAAWCASIQKNQVVSHWVCDSFIHATIIGLRGLLFQ